MLPEFKKSGHGYAICGCDVSVGRKPLCECGQDASILATFRINPPKGSTVAGRERKPLGALYLCWECAALMWEDERRAWQHNHKLQLTHYMGVEDALRMAQETATEASGRNHREGIISKRWQEIIGWVAVNEWVGIREVAAQFRESYININQGLYKLERRGVLESRVEGKYKEYRVKEEGQMEKPAG